MYISGVKIENFRGIGKETIFKFNPGITVLVGENDSGKSTVIDAIRYVLGTTDQNWYKVEFFDYHNENTEDEIRISICFSDLSLKEKAAFMECLTYTKTGEKLYLNWTAKYMKNVKPNRTLVNLTCGKNGDVSAPSPEARELLRVTYLRPLRDAYAQMRAGRNSRLAQIMSSISGLNSGIDKYESGVDVNELSLSGIFDLSSEVNEIRYLPDFYIPNLDRWFEIKAKPLSKYEMKKCEEFCFYKDNKNIKFSVLIGSPEPIRGNKFSGIMEYVWEWSSEKYPENVRILALDELSEKEYYSLFVRGLWVVPNVTEEQLTIAAIVARQARFEFGEVPHDIR